MTDYHSNTLLDHQWIYSDQAVEYMKAVKERTENQLRDFCMNLSIFFLSKFLHHLISLALLFGPALSAGLVVKQYRYKILLVGKTGRLFV